MNNKITKLLLSTAMISVVSWSVANANTDTKTSTPTPTPTSNKSGFIIAVNGGYASTQAKERITTSGFVPALQVNAATSSKLAANGLLVSLTGGYNFVFKNITFGPELEAAYQNVGSTSQGLAVHGNRKLIVKESYAAYLRCGYNFDKTLMYLKGGLKSQNMEYKVRVPTFNQQQTNKKYLRKTGIAFGLGMETLLTERSGVRLEIMHTRFGKMRSNLSTGTAKFSVAIRPVTNAATLGFFVKI